MKVYSRTGPDLVSRLKDSVPWAGFAAFVWSRVRDGLDSDQWDSLGPDQRTEKTMVLFALATVIDDARILRAAIKAVPILQGEFVDLLSGSHTQVVAMDKGILERWSDLCVSLRSLSKRAVDPQIGVDSLDEIREIVRKLSAIETEVRERSLPTLVDNLNARVNGMLTELEGDREFSWFQEGVRASIRSLWDDVQDSLSLEQVRAEIARLESNVPASVECFLMLIPKIAEAEAKRASLLSNTAEDLTALHAWEQANEEVEDLLHELRRRQREARVNLLRGLSPFGETSHILDRNLRSSGAEQGTDEPAEIPSTDKQTSGVPRDSKVTAQDGAGRQGDRGPGSDADRAPEPEDAPLRSSDPMDPTRLVAESQLVGGPREEPGEWPLIGPATHGTLSGHRSGDQVPDESGRSDGTTERCLNQMIDVLRESPPRLSYAAQVGRLSTRLSLTNDASSAALLEVASLVDHLSHADGAIAACVTDSLSAWRSLDGFSYGDDVHILLATAATLRPALLLPQTGAWEILSSLEPGDDFPALSRFVPNVAHVCRELSGVRLDSVVLQSADSESVWTREREQLSADVQEWKEGAAQLNLKYAPATGVWQRWLSTEGIITKLVALIVKDCPDNERIKGAVTPLQHRKNFHQLVKDTDRKDIGRRTGPEVEAGARTQLFVRAQMAVRFATRHMSLNETRPSRPSFTTKVISKLRNSVEQTVPIVTNELRAVADAKGRSFVSAAASVAAYAIDRFARFLKSGEGDEPDPQDVIASALFRYPSIPVDPKGFPACGDDEAFETLTRADPVDLRAAAEERLAKGDLETVQRIANWSEIEEPASADSIRCRMAEELERIERSLRLEIDATRTKIESALLRGHIQDPDRDTYEAKLVEMERRVAQSGSSDFGDGFEELKNIGSELETILARVQRSARGRLESSDIEAGTSRYSLIVEAIDRGDIVAADELITHPGEHHAWANGGQKPARLRAFSDFYPEKAEAIRVAIESWSSKQIVQEITTAQVFADMDLSDVPSERRRSAHRMVGAWYNLKHSGRLRDTDDEFLHTIFSELGFTVRGVRFVRKAKGAPGEAIVETEPLEGRERCPIPEFGSSVNGVYRVVFLWGGPAEEDILQHADKSSRQQGTIAFYFGGLGSDRRATIARLARERALSMLVIDELLLLYLCSVKDSRIPILFLCTLPLAFVQPYVTTGGLVPPEMFYGRKSEMGIIADPNGSCFIYGGRQLGKTAVLRAVESREHRPSDDSYAVWIDLKHEGIGYDRVYETGVAGIWSVIWRTLNKEIEIPGDVKDPNPNNPKIRFHIDGFIEFLVSHFDKSVGRRLLLLLDESDKFLEFDARQVQGGRGTEYRESTRLKGPYGPDRAFYQSGICRTS